MPDRIRARVVIIALLLLLTVAGIRATGAAGDWGHPAGHVLIVGLALEAVFIAMFFGLRWQRDPPPDTLAGKLHRIISAVLVVCVILVLIELILSLYKFEPGQPRRVPGRFTISHSTIRPTVTPSISIPWREILIAIVIAALIMLLMADWHRRRRRLARLRRAMLTEVDVDDAAADDLARAVESGRVALRDIDDARAAIIACYVAMENSLAEAGAARGVAETPDELLSRAIAGDLVPRAPAGLLTELFYEARYSTHHMPISKRDQAERALADIATGLPAGERT